MCASGLADTCPTEYPVILILNIAGGGRASFSRRWTCGRLLHHLGTTTCSLFLSLSTARVSANPPFVIFFVS